MFEDRSVVILSGPGGVGKGTIVKMLLNRDGTLWLSRSWTTRARRPGEPKDAYHFVDEQTFDNAVNASEFLEWVEFLDYRLGTPIPHPSAGCDILLEIDVHGARKVKEQVPEAVLIFVDAPSAEEQRDRLIRRGDNEDTIHARLIEAATERALATEMNYKIVINDDLSRAVDAIESIIAADRMRWRGKDITNKEIELQKKIKN